MKAAWILLLVVTTASAAAAQEVDQFESFRRAASLRVEPLLTHVFGNDSVLATIDSLPADGVLRFDTDGDGKIDAIAWREGKVRVAALDEDGDFRPGDRRPDRDSDCYLVDVDSDGILDRVVDYIDNDRDGDPDREDLYEITHGSLGVAGLGVTSVIDLDDDNRLFSLTDYSYHANRDQWLSDFDGNTCFVAGERDDASGRWISSMENPFCFYDDDGDGRSDEALRIEGSDLLVNSIRWSFDADGDATAEAPRDYDFSLTATGRVRVPAALADSVVLRDGGFLRFASWAGARDLARWGLWGSVLLVWDEEDQNVAPFSETPDRERWEGVIADTYGGIAQIGGPSCGRINKRYEIDRDGSGRLGLYRSDVDDRIHLLGAEEGEFQIQIPDEPPIRRVIRYRDGDGNGFFDTWSYLEEDLNKRERVFSFADEAARIVASDGPAIRRLWRQLLPAARDRSRWDLKPLEESKVLAARGSVRRWWLAARDRNDPLAARAQRSAETDRFLYDVALWEAGGGFLARNTEETGSTTAVSLACPAAGGDGLPPTETVAIAGTDRPARPPLPQDRDLAHGRVFDLSTLPPQDRDRIALLSIVEAEVDTTRVAGQLEDWDGDGRPEVVYVVPGSGASTAARALESASQQPAILLFDPPSPLPAQESVRVDPYLRSGTGFESLSIAYRTAAGGLAAFPKKGTGALILRNDLGGPGRSLPWEPDPSGAAGVRFAGLYVRDGEAAWHPLIDGDRASQQVLSGDPARTARVIAEGPSRAVVQQVFEANGLTAIRTWTLAGGDCAVLESLRIESTDDRGDVDSVTVAFTIPSSESSGRLHDGMNGAWSYLASTRGSEKVGFAGAVLDTRRVNAADGITGGFQFMIKTNETALLGWVIGGTVYGDSIAEAWGKRSADLLRERRDRDVICVAR